MVVTKDTDELLTRPVPELPGISTDKVDGERRYFAYVCKRCGKALHKFLAQVFDSSSGLGSSSGTCFVCNSPTWDMQVGYGRSWIKMPEYVEFMQLQLAIYNTKFSKASEKVRRIKEIISVISKDKYKLDRALQFMEQFGV